MPSSVIRRHFYDVDRRELWVEFVSGRRYVYEGVTLSVADQFAGALSKGTYFNTRIRDAYPFREVTPADAHTES